MTTARIDHNRHSSSTRSKAAAAKLRRARRRQRGASMVETLVLIPGFVLMFVLSTYIGQLYRNKLRTMRESKQATFTAASQNCDPASAVMNGIKAPTIREMDKTDMALGMIQNLIMGAPWTWIFTKGFNDLVQIENGSASATAVMDWGPLYATFSSKTTMTCNEKPEKVDFLKVFLYAYAKLTPFG